MAKNIYICSRKKFSDCTESDCIKSVKRWHPDNITSTEPKVVVNGDIAYGIMTPARTLLESGTSLLMGQIFGDNNKWDEPLGKFPDGSVCIFRNSPAYCEIISDPIASRTIWYYLDNDIFVASTSQRAIVMFIGSFDFDERVIPWVYRLVR